MNRTQRKLFTLFFVLLFFLVAPTVVLFAQGYRFNLQNNVFIYSGSITIKSWPRDINIYIDGEEQTNKHMSIINGARTVNGIKPGKYRITCSKPGYTSWEKDIEVHSGVSTEFWNVLLFPEKESFDIASYEVPGDFKQFFLSPESNDELVVFSEEEEKRNIYLLNTENNQTELIFGTEEFDFLPKEKGLNIEWNANNKKFILPMIDRETDQSNFILVNLEKEENQITVLDDFFEEQKISRARWMFNEKNQIVVLTEENNFFTFNHEEEAPVLIAENVSGFDFAEHKIYFTGLPNNIIWEIEQDNFTNKKQISNQPFPAIEGENLFEITAYDKYRIFLRSENDGSFLFNENRKKDSISILRPSEKVLGIQFSDDGKKMLCWNRHEVWYYMLRDWEIQPKRFFGDKITITRSSEPIKNVQWMDNYENIILSTDKTIKVFEADPRSYTNVSDLRTTKESIEEKDLIYNKNNQTLYYQENGEIRSLVLIKNSGFLNR